MVKDLVAKLEAARDALNTEVERCEKEGVTSDGYHSFVDEDSIKRGIYAERIVEDIEEFLARRSEDWDEQ